MGDGRSHVVTPSRRAARLVTSGRSLGSRTASTRGSGSSWHWTTGRSRITARSKSGGDLTCSTSVPRLTAFGCGCPVEEADLRGAVLTQIHRVVGRPRRSAVGLTMRSVRIRLVDVVDPSTTRSPGTCFSIEAATAPVQDHRARVPRPASCSHSEKRHLDRYGRTARGTSPSLDRAQQCPHTAAGSACPSAAEHPRA